MTKYGFGLEADKRKLGPYFLLSITDFRHFPGLTLLP
jgi:hypothetical protein